MRITHIARCTVAAVMTIVAVGCTDASVSTAPVSAGAFSQREASAATNSSNTSSLSGVATLTSVNVLTRMKAIPDMVASATIGKEGGSIILKGAGFTLTVPPLAVSVPTNFKVHALAGTAVAYEFEPHGTVFTVFPVFKQDLSKTNMKGLTNGVVEGAYFANASQIDPTTGTASVDQFFTTGLAVDGSLIFGLPHFSGYLVSSGRR